MGKFRCYISHRGDDNPFLHVQKYLEYTFYHMDNVCVVLGYNTNFDIKNIRRLYPKYKIIIYQLEQLMDGLSQWYNPTSQNPVVVQRTKHIKDSLKACDEIWDYSIDNIDYIKNNISNKPIIHVPLMPCEAVKVEKYDCLFYGSTNNRRDKFLKVLDKRYSLLVVSPKNKGYKNWKPPVFGDDMFNYIRNSKSVVNIHYYEGLIQEQVRIFELLSNDVTVISEVSKRNYYGDMITEFKDEFDMCIKMDKFLGKKIKVGAVYNTFYGLEHIMSSIESIKDIVSEIVVVHQRTGFNGSQEPVFNKTILDRIEQMGVKIIEYVPKDKHSQIGILEKRNIGLDYMRGKGMDYIIPLDTDEEYDSELLLREIYRMEHECLETLYSPIISYYYNKDYCFLDTYYVPSVYRVNDRNFEMTRTSVLCDPIRKMRERKYSISEVPMHHYTYMVKSYNNKKNKSIFSLHGDTLINNVDKISQHLLNWYAGKKALVHQNEKNTGNLYLAEVELTHKDNMSKTIKHEQMLMKQLSIGLVYSGRISELFEKWMDKLISDVDNFKIKPQLVIVNNSGNIINIDQYKRYFSEIKVLKGYNNATWGSNSERINNTSELLRMCYNDILANCTGELIHFREDDIIPNNGAFSVLLKEVVENKKKFVSGLYANRNNPEKVFSDEANDICNDLAQVEAVEVEFCATGFILFDNSNVPMFEKNDKIRPHDWAWIDKVRKEMCNEVFVHPNATCKHYIDNDKFVFPTLKITPENNYIKIKPRITSNPRYIW